MATRLITGCSSGLGRALACTALDCGENVVVTARDPATVDDLAEPLGITVMAVEPGAFRTNYKRSQAQTREAISDYASTVGARRNEDSVQHGNQPGDPARAAQAIITAVQSPSTPLTLVLGPDALSWVREALTELDADIDAWEQTSLSTSFSS